MDDGLVSLGLVIGLDYQNPYLSPYRELQRLKHHPYFRKLLSGDSSRIAYGARSLNEGGLQSLPKLHFPGGALLGCAAGMVNIAKIKGTHNAMKSGMLAAEAAFEAITEGKEVAGEDGVTDMSGYETRFKDSWVYKDLYEVRNLRPSFHSPLGLWGGLMYSGIDTMFLRGRTPWTLRSPQVSDAAATKKAKECKKIQYPKYEEGLSTDLLTSVGLTGTNHAEDQLVHLRVRAGSAEHAPGAETAEGLEGREVRRRHVEKNVGEYAGRLGHACPAAVYEYVDAEPEAKRVEDEGWGGKKLVINSQVRCSISVAEITDDAV